MKKIKLIAPILGLATISSSLIPLTSCNKGNNIGISKEQWTNAFAMIQDPRNENRNFTIDGKMYSHDSEGELYIDDTFKVQAAKGLTLGIDYHGLVETEPNPEYFYSAIHEDIIWTHHTNTSPIAKPVPIPIILQQNLYLDDTTLFLMDILAGMFIDSYEDLVRLDNLKFRFTAVNLDSVQGYFDFEFSSDYKVSKISANIDLILQDLSVHKIGKIDLDFTKYGSTTVDFDEDSFDYSTVLMEKATQQADKFVTQGTVTSSTSDDIAFRFDMPEDLSIDNLKNINITTDGDIDDLGLILNGKDLVQDVDYTFDETNKKIILNTALTKNDKLRIIIESDMNSKFTLELVKAE